MPLYVGDYLADTQHLTAEQHGAYLLLLMTMWRVGGSLPTDPAKLARIAKVGLRRWHLVFADLAPFFIVEGDRLTQKRLEREYQKAASISQARSVAARAKTPERSAQNVTPLLAKRSAAAEAKKSAKPLKEHDTTSAFAEHLLVQKRTYARVPQSYQEEVEGVERSLPLSSESELNFTVAPSKGGEADETISPQSSRLGRNRAYPEAFEDLWREYLPIASPNSTKYDAHKVWAKLSAAEKQLCWQGLVSYVLWVLEQRRAKDDPKVKHLETFISKRGWEPFLELRAEAEGLSAWSH